MSVVSNVTEDANSPIAPGLGTMDEKCATIE